MTDMKLIMEGWRTFLEEGEKQSGKNLLTEDQLDEGILSALKGLAIIIPMMGGTPKEVEINDVVDAYRTASVELHKAKKRVDADNYAQAKMELGQLITNLSSNIESGAISPIDFDGDGEVDELQPLITPDLSPETIKILQAAMDGHSTGPDASTKAGGDLGKIKTMQKINKGGPGKSGQLDFVK